QSHETRYEGLRARTVPVRPCWNSALPIALCSWTSSLTCAGFGPSEDGEVIGANCNAPLRWGQRESTSPKMGRDFGLATCTWHGAHHGRWDGDRICALESMLRARRASGLAGRGDELAELAGLAGLAEGHHPLDTHLLHGLASRLHVVAQVELLGMLPEYLADGA